MYRNKQLVIYAFFFTLCLHSRGIVGLLTFYLLNIMVSELSLCSQNDLKLNLQKGRKCGELRERGREVRLPIKHMKAVLCVLIKRKKSMESASYRKLLNQSDNFQGHIIALPDCIECYVYKFFLILSCYNPHFMDEKQDESTETTCPCPDSDGPSLLPTWRLFCLQACSCWNEGRCINSSFKRNQTCTACLH